MSDRAAFLAHIADHPDADLPRLVFADWLDEQGDPLGEFIRVQVELHHLQDRLGDDHTQRLMAREDELLVEHRTAWTQGFDIQFDRGLPVKVRMSWREFADTGDQLLTHKPTIRVASLGPEQWESYPPIYEATFVHMRELHLEGWPDPDFVAELLDHSDWNPAVVLRVNLRPSGNHELLEVLLQGHSRFSRLDLVQPWIGANLSRRVGAVDSDTERVIWALNRHATTKLAVPVIPSDRFYPLLGDLGSGFFAGHLKSGAAALFKIAPKGRRVAFCTFTEDGRVDKSLWEDTSDLPWTLGRIRERFGFELGFIRVREFDANNQLAVRFLWAEARELFDVGWHDEPTELADHLADPKHFSVGYRSREIAVSYRTGKATSAVG